MAYEDAAQLRARDLALHYPIYRGLFRREVGLVRAVDGVNFSLRKGETLGLVGESGCGKTSVGLAITRLVDPTGGRIDFRLGNGLVDITYCPDKEMRRIRRHMGMVFQDPFSSLNPRMSVRDIIGEPLILHRIAKGTELTDRVGTLLEMVGLSSEHQIRYPHAFSGGQRQRIAIARALATEPEFVVADEPVSSLDASVQSKVLNLLLDLQKEMSLTMLFIAHDLTVVRHMSDRIAVMYLGRIVETGASEAVCAEPLHPYTQGLLASIPTPSSRTQGIEFVPRGEIPDPRNPPSGCRFHTRCPYCQPICQTEEPVLEPAQHQPHHHAACHFMNELDLVGISRLAHTESSQEARR